MSLLKNEVGRPSNETLKRRKIFGFLIAAVVLLTVGFAALSVTLTINGTASMEGRYSVHFSGYEQNSSTVVAVNTGYAESTVPVINQDATELNNFDIDFYAPGDAVEFKFRIVNDGNINAEISDIQIGNGTFTGDDDTYVALVQNHITKTFKYVGGAKDGDDLAIGDVIAAGEEQVVSLKYTLTDFDSEVLASSVSISDLITTITYVQSAKTTNGN